MIRAALLSLGFLGITGALIALQPTAKLRPAAPDEAVTRGDIALDPPSEPAISPAPAPEPAAQTPVEMAALALPASQPETAPSPSEPAPVSSAVPAMPETDIERMVAAALREGQSDAYIDAMLGQAAATGTEIAARLVTAEGHVDSQALITALSGHRSDPNETIGGTYLVRPGDSLASIAYRSYGATELAGRIAEANRALLDRSPALLVGTRLIIPSGS